MLDLSDGLGGDAYHLATASEVGVDVDLELLPIDPAVVGPDRAVEAGLGGEDFELLATVAPGRGTALAADLLRLTGTVLTRIGRIVGNRQVRFARRGVEVALTGFDHFR
jgi:thiamine-monophosphate kinase